MAPDSGRCDCCGRCDCRGRCDCCGRCDCRGCERRVDVPPTGALRFTENCFVRATPGASGAALGFVRRGRSLPWGGRSVGGWHAALYRGGVAWVSARFATVEKA